MRGDGVGVGDVGAVSDILGRERHASDVDLCQLWLWELDASDDV
jgi:hypothetical protein